MKQVIWIIIILIILIALGVGMKGEKDDGEVTIGGLFGLTGAVSFAGEVSQNGFIMAIEDSGMDVDYVIEDFQSDLANTVSATRKLVDIDGVDVIIGPEWAEFSELTLTVTESRKIPVLSPWMTSEYDWAKTDYYFSGTPSEREQVRAILDHMVASGVEQVAFVYNINSFSENIIAIAREEIEENYSELSVVFESRTVAGTRDYRTELIKLKTENVDVIFANIEGGSFPDAFDLQRKDLGITQPVYMIEGVISVLFANNSNIDAGEGIIYPAFVQSEREQEFNEKYQKRFGNAPEALTGATTYDLTTLVLNAIKDGALTGEEITQYLNNVKDYKGYSNIINFNEHGQVASQPIEMRQVKNGESVVIEK